jgi:hypothetical protein
MKLFNEYLIKNHYNLIKSSFLTVWYQAERTANLASRLIQRDMDEDISREVNVNFEFQNYDT